MCVFKHITNPITFTVHIPGESFNDILRRFIAFDHRKSFPNKRYSIMLYIDCKTNLHIKKHSMWMEFAFQELWGQKANINTMMLISKIWHIICLFWQFSFVSRMLIGNSFWHILHYPFFKVTINDFCGNFYGWHRWSRPWLYLQIKYGYPTCGRHLYQCYRIVLDRFVSVYTLFSSRCWNNLNINVCAFYD